MDDANISLGEAKHSYGYGGTGKVATNRHYKEYGEPYGPGDYIGCYLVSRYIFLIRGRQRMTCIIFMLYIKNT